MSVPRILIVDDDTALLQALPEALKLRMSSVEVDTCDSARTALERLAKTDYDAIVSDIKMPGMDGLALLERIRALRPETPTLLLTGHGEHELTIQALRGGAYDFIQKPIDREYFVASLGRVIQMRQLSRQVEEQRRALERHAGELEQLVQERTRELVEANQAKDDLLRARDQALEQARAATREQKAARKEMERQASELSTIFEAMADGVYVCDAEGQIVRVNRRWAEMVGLPAEELLQSVTQHGAARAYRRPDGTPIPADEYPLTQALQGTTITNSRLLIRRHGTDDDLHLQVSAAPIRDADGAIVGAVAVASDVTELHQLERQKDEFLSIASHELKTPLASLKVLAQLTHRRLQRADIPVPSQLANMERSIGRMETLVNDLVDISRIDAGKLALRVERANLNELCIQVIEEQEAAGDRPIVADLPDEPLDADVDVDRIGQVLVNLLSNALKYSPVHAPVSLSLARRGDEAIIRVRDEGPGIPPDALPRIFERFFRVPGTEIQQGSGVGLGLGLYISSEIVQRHGGRIWAESGPGAGSSFYVALRLVRAGTRPSAVPSREATAPH